MTQYNATVIYDASKPYVGDVIGTCGYDNGNTYNAPIGYDALVCPVEVEEGAGTIGGGDERSPYRRKRGELGVTRGMLKPISDRILAVLEQDDTPKEVKKSVKKAVKAVAKMQQSDELSTVATEEARAAVEQAWFALQSEKSALEANYAIVSINWIVTLQQDLADLYAWIDDEEAAIVLLMTV